MDVHLEGMSSRTFIQRLRTASPAAQAQLLRAALRDTTRGSIDGITATLLNSVIGGHAPPAVIGTWIGVSRSPKAAAAAFFQSGSVHTRHIAIKHIFKMLRNDTTFEPTWRALGGTQGIGQYMAKLSINQHHEFCSALGRLHKPNDDPVQRLRRSNISDLYDFLMDSSTNTNDSRPVKSVYARLLPACSLEKAEGYLEAWDETDLESPQRLKEMEKLVQIDWLYFERRAFAKACDRSVNELNLRSLKVFVDHSQKFGLRILELLASNNKIQIADKRNFMDCLALPLARRCPTTSRSYPDKEKHNHLWKLINTVFDRHPALRQELDQPFKVRHYGSKRQDLTLVQYAARSWNHCRGDAERTAHLAALIRFLPSSWFSFEKVRGLLKGIAPSLRYKFLRIWLANSKSHRHDIGEADDYSSTSLKGLKIPVMIFTALGAIDSLKLFERCLIANPDCSFLDVGRHDILEPPILKQLQEPNSGTRPDCHVLRAFLTRRAETLKMTLPERAEVAIHNIRDVELLSRKKLAQEAKEAEIRGFWVLSAIRLCAALRDFDLLDETLTWARRFNKDPVAVKAIYPLISINSFLACGTMTMEDPVLGTKQELGETIFKANRILKSLFDNVMAIQNDKAFVGHPNWHRNIVRMATRIAITRLRKVKEIRKSLQLTEEGIYDVLLEPTAQLLIELESALIDYESVEVRDQTSMLSFGSDQVGYEDNSPGAAEIRFWDTLTRERDELWEQKRSSKHPEVMTLPPPWPRGLPIQNLIPHEMADNLPVPYVIHRAEAIVFCAPDVAFQAAPKSKEIQSAIGDFVDSYSSALRLWIRAVKDKGEQQKRMTKAWTHALGPLTGDRMTREEAGALWHSRAFASAEHLPEVTVQWDSIRFPAALPSSEDEAIPSEWDPDPGYHHQTALTARMIGSLTSLDCMLSGSQSHLSTMGDLQTETTYIRGFWGSCWDKDAWKNILSKSHDDGCPKGSNPTIDALVAAALLTLDAVHGKGSALLKTPFPTLEDPRFPAMYLDHEFLERESTDAWKAVWALKSLRAHVPAQLLVQLAYSVWTKLREEPETKHGQYHVVTSIIKLVIESDDPKLALPIIQDFVTSVQDASSYFRDLVGAKLMNRLSSEDVAMFYKSMAKHVTARLSEQESQRDSIMRGRRARSAPIVKITTVKMLAQLPRESSAIDTQQALDTLCDLFRQSSHIDVKIAALQSLRESAVDDGTRQLVNDFICQWVVEIAGSLNERHPHTEADWVAAEQGGPLPEVNADHPLLDMLLVDDSLNNASGFSEAREAFLVSTQNHARWMRLFIKRYRPNADCQPDSILLQIPAREVYLETYLERMLGLGSTQTDSEAAPPIDGLARIKSYVLATMDPPEWIEAMNKRVRGSTELASSNAGQHWISVWSSAALEHANAKWQLFGSTWACNRLNKGVAKDEDIRFYLALGDFVGDMADVCIRKGNVEALTKLVSKLRPLWNAERGCVDEERGAGMVLRHIIYEAERLRTVEWQHDPYRQPSRLPDVVRLQIELLRLSDKGYDEFTPSDRRQTERFAQEAISIVNTIANGRTPYEPRFRALCERVDEHSEQERMYIASLIGDVSTACGCDMADILRVRLAVFVLNKADEVEQWESDNGLACRGMIQRWEGSANEEFREEAFAFKKALPVRIWRKPNLLSEWFP